MSLKTMLMVWERQFCAAVDYPSAYQPSPCPPHTTRETLEGGEVPPPSKAPSLCPVQGGGLLPDQGQPPY